MLESSINESKNLLINLASATKYRIAQENGQRIFGPPLDWPDTMLIPEKGTEVFIGKIPRDCFENELIPLFQKPGVIYKMRLMIDFSGNNRGYGFVQYFTSEDAKKAVDMLNNYEIRKNWSIGVMASKNNNRLFFGNLPNNISRNEMIAEISKYTAGIKGAIYYGGAHRQNGFGFVEYENHKMTALARRKFFPGSILLFGRQPKVDWAKSEEDCDDEEVSLNKTVLYVRFFKNSTTEEEIKNFFSLINPFSCMPTWDVSRVKKIRNFAFIHYSNPNDAKNAYEYFHSINPAGTGLSEADQELEIKWAKNRPSSPISTSPCAPKSPKTNESMFFNYYSDSSKINSMPNDYNMFVCNENRSFGTFNNFFPFFTYPNANIISF